VSKAARYVFAPGLKNWVLRIAKGAIVALGFILPGVSGGVLAAILGLYEPMLRFVAHVRRDFAKNALFFLPVGVGGILGLVLLSRPLDYALEHWPVIVLWGFAGAILGSVPALLRESTSQTRRDRIDWVWLVGTFAVALVVLYALPTFAGTVPANFGGFVLAGALIAVGVLVPGFSPSNLLIILGLLQPMLAGFSDFDVLGVFLPIALGGLAALLLFARFMERMIDRHHSRTFHFVIGLVLASTVLIVVPTHSAESIDYTGTTVSTAVLAGVLFAAGLALGLWMAHLEKRYKTIEVIDRTAHEIAAGD
jgi:putative membrane protein